jgi:hypothetical protein
MRSIFFGLLCLFVSCKSHVPVDLGKIVDDVPDAVVAASDVLPEEVWVQTVETVIVARSSEQSNVCLEPTASVDVCTDVEETQCLETLLFVK